MGQAGEKELTQIQSELVAEGSASGTALHIINAAQQRLKNMWTNLSRHSLVRGAKQKASKAAARAQQVQ